MKNKPHVNIPFTKGEFGKECNRTVCENKNAKWYNCSTQKYYCAECANLINRVNPEFTKENGFPLCKLVTTEL